MKESTHWDTSAMCLCLRLTHRSSSSCNSTSFTRESPMPLVSYLQDDITKHSELEILCVCVCVGGASSFICSLLVDVIFDGEQVVAHGLEGELMQHR